MGVVPQDPYQEQEQDAAQSEDAAIYLQCEAEHIDGSMNASKKEEKLTWLKAAIPENTCRILSNVRCWGCKPKPPKIPASP